MKTFSGQIERVTCDQIFVFGSNTQGRHGMGAALFAWQKCGAIYGQARELQGQSYAICTKDLTKKAHPSISKEEIIRQIKELYDFARKSPMIDFLVPYRAKANNLCGYTSKELAEMFAAEEIPVNIVFEETFSELVQSIAPRMFRVP